MDGRQRAALDGSERSRLSSHPASAVVCIAKTDIGEHSDLITMVNGGGPLFSALRASNFKQIYDTSSFCCCTIQHSRRVFEYLDSAWSFAIDYDPLLVGHDLQKARLWYGAMRLDF